MARVRVGVTIEAVPRVVWAAIADISTHVEWMDDAVEIRFTGRRREGAGTPSGVRRSTRLAPRQHARGERRGEHAAQHESGLAQRCPPVDGSW